MNEKEIRSIVNKTLRYRSLITNVISNPTTYHKLKHLPTLINMSLYYDIKQQSFDPFLRDAKNVLIEDPYLPNTKASLNLWNCL